MCDCFDIIRNLDDMGECWRFARIRTWAVSVGETPLWSLDIMWCLYGWTSELKLWAAHWMFGSRDVRPFEQDKKHGRFSGGSLLVSFVFFFSQYSNLMEKYLCSVVSAFLFQAIICWHFYFLFLWLSFCACLCFLATTPCQLSCCGGFWSKKETTTLVCRHDDQCPCAQHVCGMLCVR